MKRCIVAGEVLLGKDEGCQKYFSTLKGGLRNLITKPVSNGMDSSLPQRHLKCHTGFENPVNGKKEPKMKIMRVGVDLAKNVFHVHGVDRSEKPVWERRLSRENRRRQNP